MNSSLIISIAVCVASALAMFPIAIRLAPRLGLVDVPNSRRRHDRPMPMIGGATLLVSWALGLMTYCLCQPEWARSHGTSLLVLGIGVLTLTVLGLVDDVKGLGPRPKLFFQLSVAVFTILCEPSIKIFLGEWQAHLGWFAYPVALVWIIGVSNAINLIDGLDGLAGGVSILAVGCVCWLSYHSQGSLNGIQPFGGVITLILAPAILCFLLFNWNPAKTFLGDNGSLPLGYLISTMGMLIHPAGSPETTSWLNAAGLVMMLAYPITDMGLATYRRFRAKHSLFKADRSHLHYRIQRLGLTVRETTVLIMSVGMVFQLGAIGTMVMPGEAGVITSLITGLSIFNFLFLIKLAEGWRVRRAALIARHRMPAKLTLKEVPVLTENTIALIDLEPLFEVSLLEEKDQLVPILLSLTQMLQRRLRKMDRIILLDRQICIIFAESSAAPQHWEKMQEEIRVRLDQFQTLFNIQYSLAALPIHFKKLPATHSKPQDADRGELAS